MLNSLQPNAPSLCRFPGSPRQWGTASRQGQGRLPWGHPQGTMPRMSIAHLEAYFQAQQLPPTARFLGGLPVSMRHHGRPAALVPSHPRSTHRVRTSNPGEPLQPGKPGYPASPCQTDKAGVSMSGARGKTPSIIPEPLKEHSSPVPDWQIDIPPGKEHHCSTQDTSFIPRPQNAFGGANVRVLRLSKVPQRDLPSCHRCHQFHACLSHPETENRHHE